MLIEYFKYVHNHRKNIRKLCFQDHRYLMGIFHDIDKYLPLTFYSYAKHFYGKELRKDDKAFNKAQVRHYKRTSHHWNKYILSHMEYARDFKHYAGKKVEINPTYVAIEMPTNAVIEMIYDWTAMGKVFGNTAQEYYLKNYHRIKLSRSTRYFVECRLKLIEDCDFGPICECNNEYWMTLQELALNSTEESFEESVATLEKKYMVANLYDIVTNKRKW